MNYEKLSKNALGCMYVATGIGSIIILAILGIVNWFLLFPENIWIGKAASAFIAVLVILDAVIGPYFRFCRYRYCINEECIDMKEGVLFVTRTIVPIERLHKLETERGPIDRMFKVAKVKVSTGGGDVILRFLEEEKADMIADGLRKRINQIVVEQRTEEENGREQEI